MRLLSLVLLLGLLVAPASAQLARNPKIGAEDLAAAQAETSLAGGATAELIYAARLDAVQKGAFDCLIVIYSKSIKDGKNSKNGKDFFAVILREEKKHPLALDKAGRALKVGDKFLRMGLRHEEGKPPLLRLIASATDPAKGEQQRNLDYRFNGAEFVLETQSLVPLAK